MILRVAVLFFVCGSYTSTDYVLTPNSNQIDYWFVNSNFPFSIKMISLSFNRFSFFRLSLILYTMLSSYFKHWNCISFVQLCIILQWTFILEWQGKTILRFSSAYAVLFAGIGLASDVILVNYNK